MRREKVLHMHERIALDKPLLPRLCKMMPLGGQLFSALLKPVEIGGRKIVFAFERDAPRGLPFVWPSWVCNFRSNFDRHRCQFCSNREARRDHLIAAVAGKIQGFAERRCFNAPVPRFPRWAEDDRTARLRSLPTIVPTIARE